MRGSLSISASIVSGVLVQFSSSSIESGVTSLPRVVLGSYISLRRLVVVGRVVGLIVVGRVVEVVTRVVGVVVVCTVVTVVVVGVVSLVTSFFLVVVGASGLVTIFVVGRRSGDLPRVVAVDFGVVVYSTK